MRVINLFGGSGVGKTTTAEGLSFLMKIQGYSVELIPEYAKQLTWGKRFNTLRDHHYVFAKQNSKLLLAKDEVDYSIVDSPLPLSVVYGLYYNPELSKTFQKNVLETFESYDNTNFFINRTVKFNPVGRNETEEQSNEVSALVKKCLGDNQYNYTEVDGRYQAAWDIYKEVTGKYHTIRPY